MRRVQVREDREIEKGVTLLASILVRYPEVSTVNLDSKFRILKLTFILKGPVPSDRIKAFETKLRDSLDAYSHIIEEKASPLCVKTVEFEDITILELERDVESLTQEELSLIIGLLHLEFQELIVAEYTAHLSEEDMFLQDEIIESMLEDIRGAKTGRNLVGYKDDGRVLVFNMNMRKL
jgi:hypothetical protein